MNRHPYDSAQDRELARWPGVTWSREIAGKHLKLVVEFEGQSRFIVFPTSPSDSTRGPLNHVQNIRQTLKEMGAETVPQVAAQSLRRTPNPTTPRRFRLGERPQGGPSRDPWEPLRSLQNGLDRRGLE